MKIKNYTSLLPFILFSFLCVAQTGVSGQSDWQDPAVFERNQVLPHAFLVPYVSEVQALTYDPAQSPYYLSLNGNWKFRLFETPADVPGDFHTPGFDTKKWDNIRVPSHWEMEGFGHPKFRNIAMTIETKPPFVPDYHNPTGCYKRSFSLPAGWKGREVFLRFEGIKSASTVWINGQEAGYNQGGFEPAEYNITPYLKTGKNDISVMVLRYSDGAFLENQDMWRLSGIYRSLALISRPGVHIHDYYVYTDFDSLYRDAVMHLAVDVQNLSGRNQNGYGVEVSLLDGLGRPVWDKPLMKATGDLDESEIHQVLFSAAVKDPLKWSAEKPDLYSLVITLKDPADKPLEVIARRTGFRKTEIRDGAIWVNGVMVKLNGVNSHMHHPEHGQAVPVETLRRDLVIMKQFNINCVRTCHYPPSPEYLDLADELGMYIVCEAGIECHDNEYLSEDPLWKDMFVDRAGKMVYRDRNHASVIFWSAGNEAGSGDNIRAMIEEGKKIDPARPFWMYGGNDFYIPFEDIVGPRYWRPLEILNLAEDRVLDPSDQRPSFQDEYLAATGNGLGGLDEYWELIRKHPRLTGGAIWDWISPGVKTPVVFTPDASPLKNHPAIMGRPQFVEGFRGKALRFSGHDDWVEFYRHPDLDLDGTGLTIAFHVKPEKNIQPNTFLTKGSHQFGITQPAPGEIEFYVHTGKRHSVRVNVPKEWYGNWHHVAGIYDGEKVELYIDFSKAGETAASGNIRNTPYPLCLGRDAEEHDQGEFRGRLSACTMDEVLVFNRALGIDELKDKPFDMLTRNALAGLSFEETRNEGHFFGTGLGGRTYGIIWPDRSIQPEIYQIRKSAQPVLIEAMDPAKGILRITNRFHFTSLDELVVSWTVSDAGRVVREGQSGLTVYAKPGETSLMDLGFGQGEFDGLEEPILTVSFRLKEKQNWAEAGHELAWEEFLLPVKPIKPEIVRSTAGQVKIEQTGESLTLTGNNFSYRMDVRTGSFLSMKFHGNELIVSGFDFSVWRPPLANDTDPWGSWEFTKSNYTPGLGRSIDNQLRTLGLDRLEHRVHSVETRNLSDGKAEVNLVLYSTGTTGRSGFEEHRGYTFHPDGTIELDHRIIPHGDMPSLLPKTGIRFLLPTEFRNIEWYGRGPFETYPDRKTGARTGVWKSTAEQEYVPYLIPQDHGNKTDVRWLKISNGSGSGFMISGDEWLNFSLHAYSADNLSRAVYPFQLKKADHLTLNVDYEVTGVGETARRTLAKYRVMPAVKRYRIEVKPFIP